MKILHFIILQFLVNYGFSINNNQNSIDPVNKISFIEKNLNKLGNVASQNNNEIKNKQKMAKDVSHRYAINQLEPDLASTIFDKKNNGNRNPLQRTTTISNQQPLVDSNNTSTLRRGPRHAVFEMSAAKDYDTIISDFNIDEEGVNINYNKDEIIKPTKNVIANIQSSKTNITSNDFNTLLPSKSQSEIDNFFNENEENPIDDSITSIETSTKKSTINKKKTLELSKRNHEETSKVLMLEKVNFQNDEEIIDSDYENETKNAEETTIKKLNSQKTIVDDTESALYNNIQRKRRYIYIKNNINRRLKRQFNNFLLRTKMPLIEKLRENVITNKTKILFNKTIVDVDLEDTTKKIKVTNTTTVLPIFVNFDDLRTTKSIKFEIVNTTKTPQISLKVDTKTKETTKEINTTIITPIVVNQTIEISNITKSTQKDNLIKLNFNEKHLNKNGLHLINDNENFLKDSLPPSESLNIINNNNNITFVKEIKHHINAPNNIMINARATQMPNIQNPQINIYYVGRKKYIIKSIPIEQHYQQQMQLRQQLQHQRIRKSNLQAQELSQNQLQNKPLINLANDVSSARDNKNLDNFLITKTTILPDIISTRTVYQKPHIKVEIGDFHDKSISARQRNKI